MVTSPGITPSTTRNPPSVQLSTKYNLRMSNLCAQHDIFCRIKAPSHCHMYACQCNGTMLQLTLVTHGHFLRVRLGATKGTYIPIATHTTLIITVLPCRCGPYMCKYVFPWTTWWVLYLSSNQKWLQMQEYTHVLMQLSTGSRPYIPYGAPMPHARAEWLHHPCLLGGRKGANITSGYLTLAVLGALHWAEWLHHPYLVGSP